jgi:hypothetical protein
MVWVSSAMVADAPNQVGKRVVQCWFMTDMRVRLPSRRQWRGGRVVYRTCLENRSARKGTEGSNPSLSALFTMDGKE